ncbi:MAG: hypothetical protein C4560_01325 [Nitrospiraceae bacterium]|nr:MAG: hypothetical protein C4560_01325 [Nitrospiraceae bacterium]
MSLSKIINCGWFCEVKKGVFVIKTVLLAVSLVFLLSSISYAECEALEYDFTAYDSLMDGLSVYFPFSVLSSVTNWAVSVSEMVPLSPAGYELTLFGNTFVPLAFLDSVAADYFFTGMRWLFLVLVVVQFASHVLSRIL